MRPIQNNLANLQINQIAAEQAALQASKNQQPARVRAETAEEILKEQDKKNSNAQKSSTMSSTDPNGKKKSNSQNFKNVLYSKDGIPQTNVDNPPDESTQPPQITHIDFKV
jgi:hypothetical protein